MAKYAPEDIQKLCRRLEVDSGFFVDCLEASIVEIQETEEGQIDLTNGSLLQLRRLQRICHTFHVEVFMGWHLLALTQRIAELEDQLHLLTARGENSK